MRILDIFRKKSNNAIEDYNSSISDNEIKINDLPYEIITNSSFALNVEDVFVISGRGIVAVGKVINGCVNVGANVFVKNIKNGEIIESTVIGIEKLKKLVDVAYQGERVGLLLGNIKKEQIDHGDIVYKE